ncbi:MAG: undecaprenyldiphospho-muramoylpentapeptide beta-N-acetylglucosaminyltransferase [Desulfobacterales bacterium]
MSAGASLKIAIAGGGTGGHLFPGIAVAEEFRRRHPETRVLFLSRGNELERRALEHAGFPLATIAVEGIVGRGRFRQLRALAKLPRACLQAGRHLRAFRPDLVLGLGSYSAGPVVIAARLLGIPIALCEQNSRPGATNRLLARFADRVFVAFPQTVGSFPAGRALWTGNPLRRGVLAAREPRSPSPSPPERGFTLLVLGGSQGAHRLNTAMLEALPFLEGVRGRLRVLHQSGAADEEAVRGAYARAGFSARVEAFFHDMGDIYRRADLVVCRAGATTIAEITALGRAAIFVPFPHAAADHQTENAARLVEAGAAEMIAEGELNGQRLAGRLLALMQAPALLSERGRRAAELGKPEAACAVVEECLRLIAARCAVRKRGGARVP